VSLNPTQPEVSEHGPANVGAADPKPSQANPGGSRGEIEHGTRNPPAKSLGWAAGSLPVVLWFAAFILVTALLVLVVQFAGKKVISSLAQQGSRDARPTLRSTSDSSLQAEAEELLQRAAANDAAAPDQVLARSGSWIGKTQRTSKANQLITAALDSHNLHVREASIQAELALDGVPWNAHGLNTAEQAVENPSQRAWALWTLGALGNRGVDPPHVAKVIETYLSDANPNVRVSAVNALALLGSDETVPLLLDRFRNDSSPAVQEQAACGLAEAGMYTHPQRMVAAASMVTWLDDPLTTTQQRMWAIQALRDISGQNLGPESAAWRQWYENAH
jgi:hypothetical protein